MAVMEAMERTRDLYEQIEGYPKPPLIPIVEPNDPESIETMGLKLGGASRWLLRILLSMSGFTAFQRRLPHTIEDILRRCYIRGYCFNAIWNSATLVLEDDPRDLSPIARAATLIFAARSFYNDIISARLEPDRYRDQVLEMGQYPNLFSTSIVWDGKRPRIFKSSNLSQITVVVAGRFYLLNVGHLGVDTTIEQLIEALSELVRTAQKNRPKDDEPALGILTCATSATQRIAFRQLQKAQVNRESLLALRHSFLTVCLDFDASPSSHSEAAHIAHSGNCANRWYHSSLQLVVFGNARACGICSWDAYLDGNTMTRAACEIQRRAVACLAGDGEKKGSKSLLPMTELRWQVEKELVERAQKDVQAISDDQQATFEIQGIGSSFFAANELPPIPVFIIALQMAANRLIGKTAKIVQALNMSKYSCMGVMGGIVSTPEVKRFLAYIEDDKVQYDEVMTFLREAIDSQGRAIRQVRRSLPLVAIIPLFIRSREGIRRWYVLIFFILTLFVLRVTRSYNPERADVLVSHPKIYPEVPLVGRPGIRRVPYAKAFGLHYQIFEDKIVITIMSGTDWKVSNERLISVLRESLERIQSIIRGA